MVRLRTTIYLRTGAYFVSLFELLGELNPPMAQTKALESRGGLQRHDNIVTFYYIRLTFLDVEPTQPTPSTAPPLPCETHPAQRSPIKLLEMINRWFQEPVRAPIRDCRVLCFFFGGGGFWNITSSLRRRAELSEGRKATPRKEAGKQPVGKESAVEERHCRRHHRPRALRVAPVCKKPLAAQARELRDPSNSQERLGLEFGGEPDGYSKIICLKRAGISSARSTAPGEERWYVEYHRPRSRPRALQRSVSV